MFRFSPTGACCAFPRRPYSPATLPAEYHEAVWESFRRAAYRDHVYAASHPKAGQERIRTPEQRAGLRERAEESASVAYLHWQGLEGAGWIAYGDHTRAIAATIRFMHRSAWQGATGYRRDARREATEESLALAARLRQRNVPTPCQIAQWGERVPADRGESGLAAQRRKARILAESLGLDVGGLARLANGLSVESGEHRPRRVHPAPIPAPLPDPFPAERTGMTTVDARHGWVVRPDPEGTLPEVRYAGATARESEG